MHKSVFTYGLTKPYPYRWFTWLVIIGGVAATVLFSVINLVATGYEPSNIYVASPNETEHPVDLKWFQRKPWSWSNNVVSSCQSQTVLIATQVFTTTLALRYTVYGLTRPNDSSSNKLSKYSMVYHDDTLQDCVVVSIELSPTGPTDPFGGRDLGIEAFIKCLLYEDSMSVITTFRLSASVSDEGINDDSGAIEFLGDFYQNTSASLLLASDTMFFYNSLRQQSSNTSYAGTWNFYTPDRSSPTRDRGSSSVVASITSSDGGEVFIGQDTNISTILWTSTFGDEIITTGQMTIQSDSDDLTITNMSDSFIQEAIYLDGLSKTLYSLILTDFGQSVQDNIFDQPQNARHFMDKTALLASERNDISLMTDCMSSNQSDIIDSESLNIVEFFGRCGNGSLPHVNPARIAQQYLCQVPKLKSGMSLVVGIIIADLVFLQALWMVFSWITTYFLQRQDPSANYCVGCARTVPFQRLDELKPQFGTTATDATPTSTGYQKLEALVRSSERSSIHVTSRTASVTSSTNLHPRNDSSAQRLLSGAWI